MFINLLIFGSLGMTIEVLFNAILSYALGRRNSLCLKGEISAWMFPVYAIGLTIGFDIIEQTITVTTLRWLSYPLWIWGIELLIVNYGTIVTFLTDCIIRVLLAFFTHHSGYYLE